MYFTRSGLTQFVWLFNLWVGLSLFFTYLGIYNWGLLGFLTFPGYWLWGSFSFMALYPCVYLTLMYYKAINNRLTARFLFAWHYGILIFFTLSLFFRFITTTNLNAPVLRFFAGLFGKEGGAVLTFLFLIVELICLYQLDTYLFPKKLKRKTACARETKPSLESKEALDIYHREGFSLDQEEEEALIHDLEEAKKQTGFKNKEESRSSALEYSLYGEDSEEEMDEESLFSTKNTPNSQRVGLKAEYPEEVETIYLPLSGRKSFLSKNAEMAEVDNGDIALETVQSGESKSRSYNLHDFFSFVRGVGHYEVTQDNQKEAQILKNTLQEFNIEAEVVGIYRGPVVTTFEILPAQGIKLSRITSLADNLALRLAAPRLRILAPIPGKEAVGIELPNKVRDVVNLGELFNSETYKQSHLGLPFALGKTVLGQVRIVDLARAPHLLIAGATGAGKSVCLNTLIVSLLYALSPQELKLVMIDPKIVELKFFNHIPHLVTPVVTDAKKAMQVMQWCVREMEKRYRLLDSIGTRDIISFNQKVKEQKLALSLMPYLVIIMDEFADLMMLQGKELEGLIARLAAMSRAVGIHLVLATQRPSVDVITGIIKANFPSRIAFMVSSKLDSRIILDTAGAEQLLGRGDMLVSVPWLPYPERLQGAFLSEEELEVFIKKVKSLGEPEYLDDEIFETDGPAEEEVFEEDDPLYYKAIEIVTTEKKASASYLQRRLKIGYNRAARFIECMENQGIIGPQQGAKPREILQ